MIFSRFSNAGQKILGDDDVLINSMDFIDVAVSDDDVLVNLDAFDMLGDFPELEILDSNNHDSIGKKSVPTPPSFLFPYQDV